MSASERAVEPKSVGKCIILDICDISGSLSGLWAVSIIRRCVDGSV